jgi:hypothetical protein
LPTLERENVASWLIRGVDASAEAIPHWKALAFGRRLQMAVNELANVLHTFFLNVVNED